MSATLARVFKSRLSTQNDVDMTNDSLGGSIYCFREGSSLDRDEHSPPRIRLRSQAKNKIMKIREDGSRDLIDYD